MDEFKFDGIIFGNGMTINLLKQLKPYVKKDKEYLLNIDDFLKRFIDGKLSYKEDGKIFNIFYTSKSIDNVKYFEKLKYELSKYYLKNDSNIEKILGRDLFIGKNKDTGYDLSTISSIFPALYNIWFNILYDYIIYLDLEKYVDAYYKSIKSVILNSANVYTTNFDYFADDYLDIEHLHGKFLKKLSKHKDVVLYHKDSEEYIFKHIWGYNGIGKINAINEIKSSGVPFKEYFDFDFFYDKNTKIDNLLVYGLGFQRHGAITKEFLERFPKYNIEMAPGSVIDEHIIIRIKALQDLGNLKNITVSYYSENTKDYFQLLFGQYEIDNVEFVHASNFDFSIK